MVFQGKRKITPGHYQSVTLARPIVVREGDLDRASHLLDLFSEGYGTENGNRAFGIALNRCGRSVSEVNAPQAVPDAEAIARPWRWLAAVARTASAGGDRLLVARIAFAAGYWDTRVTPTLGLADFFEGLVGGLSDDARGVLFSAAVRTLSELPNDTVVMTTGTAGSVRLPEVLLLSARALLTVEQLADPDSARLARGVLATS